MPHYYCAGLEASRLRHYLSSTQLKMLNETRWLPVTGSDKRPWYIRVSPCNNVWQRRENTFYIYCGLPLRVGALFDVMLAQMLLVATNAPLFQRQAVCAGVSLVGPPLWAA